MSAVQPVQLLATMRSYAKVFTLLCLLVGSALAAGEEDEDATTLEMMEEKQTGDPESSPQEEESSETKEKRGLFRVTGVLGENSQYPFLYNLPQAAAPPAQYDPRAAGAAPAQMYARPYAFPQAINAQPTYQQPLVLPSASSPATPFPYGAPTPMILLMMPPHPGNPYGSLMIVPVNNIFPQYTPNHIPFPYQAAGRLPVQLYQPQYVPAKGVPAAHYKGSEYQQKPLGISQASVYQSYQDPSSSEEMDQSSASNPPGYGGRQQQYVKG